MQKPAKEIYEWLILGAKKIQRQNDAADRARDEANGGKESWMWE